MWQFIYSYASLGIFLFFHVFNLTVVFGTIVLHMGTFQHFHVLINQSNLSDLHKPLNLEL